MSFSPEPRISPTSMPLIARSSQPTRRPAPRWCRGSPLMPASRSMSWLVCRKVERPSPAGHAHMPAKSRLVAPPVDDEVMPARLARDCLEDGRIEQIVFRRGSQRRPEIGRILLAEAHEERAGAGQPHPVAALAEIMGERGDEAEAPAGLGDPHIARRPAGLVIDLLQ